MTTLLASVGVDVPVKAIIWERRILHFLIVGDCVLVYPFNFWVFLLSLYNKPNNQSINLLLV